MKDYFEFLKLDPETFDQDETKGWRKISDPADRIGAITAYLGEHQETLRKGSVDDRELQALMHFHIGQSLLAISDDNAQAAIDHFKQSEFDGQDRWNTYVAATIAYLQQDTGHVRDCLERIIEFENKEVSHKNLSKTTRRLLENLEAGQISYNKAL
jgi:cation transport regulator ChaC